MELGRGTEGVRIIDDWRGENEAFELRHTSVWFGSISTIELTGFMKSLHMDDWSFEIGLNAVF